MEWGDEWEFSSAGECVFSFGFSLASFHLLSCLCRRGRLKERAGGDVFASDDVSGAKCHWWLVAKGFTCLQP